MPGNIPSDHLLDKGPHGHHADNLEVVQVDCVDSIYVLVYLSQDTQQGHVVLTHILSTNTHTCDGMHVHIHVSNVP